MNIDVLIAVDTGDIKEKVRTGQYKVSTDMNRPTQISTSSQYMICYDPRGGITGQGTGNLGFTALNEDTVNFRGMSIEANSDDAVIVYHFEHLNGDKVFGNNPWTCKITERSQAVVPDPTRVGTGGVPPVYRSLPFSRFTNDVSAGGTETYRLWFGVYTLKNGQTQELLGYFSWDPTITVPKF